MCWGDSYERRKKYQKKEKKRKNTRKICNEFSADIKAKENVDIYQLNAVISATYPKGWDRYVFIPIYRLQAIVCFAFQTVMLVLMIYQFSKKNIDVKANYTNWITKTVACTASLYISFSILTWWMNIEKQGLYRMDYKHFTNCPTYVNKRWIIFGLYANFLTLILALIGSNLLILWAEDALEVILNCVAIFWLVQVDNEIIGHSDYINLENWLSDYRKVKKKENKNETNDENKELENETLIDDDEQKHDANYQEIADIVNSILDKRLKEKVSTEVIDSDGDKITECNLSCKHCTKINTESCWFLWWYTPLFMLVPITAVCAIVAPFVITIVALNIL